MLKNNSKYVTVVIAAMSATRCARAMKAVRDNVANILLLIIDLPLSVVPHSAISWARRPDWKTLVVSSLPEIPK